MGVALSEKPSTRQEGRPAPQDELMLLERRFRSIVSGESLESKKGFLRDLIYALDKNPLGRHWLMYFWDISAFTASDGLDLSLATRAIKKRSFQTLVESEWSSLNFEFLKGWATDFVPYNPDAVGKAFQSTVSKEINRRERESLRAEVAEAHTRFQKIELIIQVTTAKNSTLLAPVKTLLGEQIQKLTHRQLSDTEKAHFIEVFENLLSAMWDEQTYDQIIAILRALNDALPKLPQKGGVKKKNEN